MPVVAVLCAYRLNRGANVRIKYIVLSPAFIVPFTRGIYADQGDSDFTTDPLIRNIE